MEKYEQVTQCIKANQLLHLQVSRGNIVLLCADSVTVLQSYSCFLHPDQTPTLHGGQTWVCMRFWSGRVRSEFCEEDWE